EMLQDDIQFMGPVRLRDVEEAQQRIVNIIRRLEETGEIVVARGGGDEIIV
ncbi:MAG: FliG C-terminal domain-containing protein, partial [Syntrophomonas sp.]